MVEPEPHRSGPGFNCDIVATVARGSAVKGHVVVLPSRSATIDHVLARRRIRLHPLEWLIVLNVPPSCWPIFARPGRPPAQFRTR